MKRTFLLVLTLLAMLSTGAHAQQAVRKTVEGSMQVTGQVVITPEGRLQSYTLHRPEALPADVRQLLSRYLPACTFEVTTTGGAPGTVTANMALHVVARQSDDGGSIISVAGSSFQDPDTPEYVKAVDMAPPHYPMSAWQQGFSGIVYVVLRLTADGEVAEAHAEQVNMTVVAKPRQLAEGRTLLTKAALVKARQWRFQVSPDHPAIDELVAVRVPVDFVFADKPAAEEKYGRWEAYVPGPWQRAPWDDSNGSGRALGALAAGSLHPLDPNIKLREPVPRGG